MTQTQVNIVLLVLTQELDHGINNILLDLEL